MWNWIGPTTGNCVGTQKIVVPTSIGEPTRIAFLAEAGGTRVEIAYYGCPHLKSNAISSDGAITSIV